MITEESKMLIKKYTFHIGHEIGEVVEHIVKINEDEFFTEGLIEYHVVKCLDKEDKPSKALIEISILLSETGESSKAVWVYDYGIFGECNSGSVKEDVKPYKGFKHAWVRCAVSRYWDFKEVVVEATITLRWKKEEAPPPEEEEPEEPEEPEKPEEPFDVGKWIEWALRNILRDKEPPTCSPHNTLLLVSLLATIYLNTLTDINTWIALLGLTPIPSIFLSEPWRIFTHMWLHYPMVEMFDSWIIPHAHLAFNVLFLWVFGDNIECKLGYGKYLAYYIICGIVAGLGEVAWLHIIGLGFEPILMIGASGAISGVMGMYLVIYPENTVVFVGKEMKAWYFLIAWFVGQVAMLFQMGIDVAVAAHITGFITGAGLALNEKRMEVEA